MFSFFFIVEHKTEPLSIAFLLQICPNLLHPPTTISCLLPLNPLKHSILFQMLTLCSCLPSACNLLFTCTCQNSTPGTNLWTTSLVLKAFKMLFPFLYFVLNSWGYAAVGEPARYTFILSVTYKKQPQSKFSILT